MTFLVFNVNALKYVHDCAIGLSTIFEQNLSNVLEANFSVFIDFRFEIPISKQHRTDVHMGD